MINLLDLFKKNYMRSPLHARQDLSYFETNGIHQQKSKTWASVAPEKGLMSSKTFS